MNFKNLLIIAAMAEEEAALLAKLREFPVETVNLSRSLQISAKRVTVGKKHISLIQSGMGPVNAALAVAAFAEKLSPDAILLLGVAGALHPDLRIGELVVSQEVLQHDYYASLDEGSFRMAPGHIVFSKEDARAHVAHFRADPTLVTWVHRAIPGARIGAVLSGNEFVGTSARKLAIAALHQEALSVEMEAAGVAQVAHRLRTPFVVAKTIADRLHPDGSIENDFKQCLNAAAQNAALILEEILRAFKLS